MPEYLELDLAGAALRVELADVGQAAGSGALPPEFGVPEPVSTGGGRGAALAAGALRATLSPLGPLLDEVHASVSRAQRPPAEFTVEFGIEVGKDLKLGIVGLKGSATMTVSATWRGAEEPSAAGAGAGDGTGPGTGQDAGAGAGHGTGQGAGAGGTSGDSTGA
ncbi:CU044_2847 family protein [Streptomyces sp. NPDC087300]|uniref:CU044_2847 family protein n=1 Tax=Streptomyces sp. NPDC087300 TaxID=3365780 RepID=UPI0038029854